MTYSRIDDGSPPRSTIGVVRWGLIAACAVLLAPLAPAVMLALWLSSLAGVLHRPLTRRLGGRVRLAAWISVIALTAILIPFILVVASLAADAFALATQLVHSPRGKEVLEQLVAKSGSSEHGASGYWNFLLGQEDRAWGLIQQVAGTATRVVIGLVVIVGGTYALLVDGKSWWAGLEARSPIPPAMLDRLRDAFYETGRGLFIGIGGAGLVQAVVATIAYLVLGVPHAFELGMLTFCFSVFPAVGTAIVWVPVAIGLALTDRTGAAIALAIIGIGVIGTVDNLVRPILARRGSLQLPSYVVLVSMFAGVQVIGAWGLLVAPLVVRLAKAALEPAEGEATR
jgi:predicted PurR-regulated permease PerM